MAPTPQDQSAWLDPLKRFAEVEQASLFVDVDLASVPRAFDFRAPSGLEGLDRLGVAIDRSWSLVDGTYVFRRKIDSGDMREASPLQHVHLFLRPLGVLDLNSLRLGELSYSSLRTDQRRALRYVIASSGDGVGDSMLAHFSDQIGMRLVLETRLTARSRTADDFAVLDVSNENSAVPLPVGTSVSIATDPLGSPDDGELDFGSGQVLTLEAIVAKAQAAFGNATSFDQRFAQSKYFVSGKFTQRRFLTTLTSVTEPTNVAIVAPDAVQSPVEIEALRNLVFGPYRNEKIGLADITVGDALDGASKSFIDSFGKRPPQRIQAFMYEHRLEPTDEFKVSAALSLTIAAPGMATIFSSQRDAIGRPIPYNTLHLIKIAL